MNATSPCSGGRRFRKLRIASSAACSIACVLLIVLWVRSYWFEDSIARYNVRVGSNTGTIWTQVTPTFSYTFWYRRCVPLVKGANLFGAPPHFEYWQGQDPTGQPYTRVCLPHWLFVFALLILALAPWIPGRFSLRNMLIATTLVAAVLGLAVHFSN